MPDISDSLLEPGAAGGPDAHGQAALLLIESLMHELVARSVITARDAVEIVEIAAEVKSEKASDLGDTPARMRHSLHLLSAIGRTFGTDG